MLPSLPKGTRTHQNKVQVNSYSKEQGLGIHSALSIVGAGIGLAESVMRIYLNGKELEGLMDTGASDNFISSKLARKLGLCWDGN